MSNFQNLSDNDIFYSIYGENLSDDDIFYSVYEPDIENHIGLDPSKYMQQLESQSKKLTRDMKLVNINFENYPQSLSPSYVNDIPINEKYFFSSCLQFLRMIEENNRFSDFKNVSEVYFLGGKQTEKSANGLLFKTKYNDTDLIVKSIHIKQEFIADNLLFEYITGLCLNKMSCYYPIFIKTLGLIKYSNSEYNDLIKFYDLQEKNSNLGKNHKININNIFNIINSPLDNYIDTYQYIKESCDHPSQWGILFPFINSIDSFFYPLNH